jgi:hypothetical protein
MRNFLFSVGAPVDLFSIVILKDFSGTLQDWTSFF